MPSNPVVTEFTAELRALWHAAGRPSYRELARRTHYGRTTLHEALQGARLPSSDVTTRLVAALGGDVERWRAEWATASRALDDHAVVPVPPVPPVPSVAPDEHAVPRPRAASGGRLVPGAAAVPARPAQVPPDLADFVGRAAEADAVAALLTADPATRTAPPVVVLTGRAGVGKSALARRVAHRVRGAYPDGQLYAALRDPAGERRPAGDVATAFARALGVPAADVPPTLDERAALCRSLLAGRRVLVVLDDAADAAHVRPLVPGEPGCAVLATARERPAGLAGATVVDVDVFDPDDAVRLLAHVAGADRVAASPAAADEVARACGLLPLAVRIAASRLAARPHWPVARLAEHLRDEHARLDALAVGDLAVRASLALSERALDTPDRDALLLLATLDVPDLAPWLAAAVLGRPVADAAEVVERLVEARLFDVAGTDATGAQRHRFHDLVRLYARERAAGLPAAARREALARAAGALLAIASRAAVPLFVELHAADPAPDPCWPPGGWAATIPADLAAWWEAESRSVLGVLRQAVVAGLLPLAGELLTRLTPYLGRPDDEDELARCAAADVVFTATRETGGTAIATDELRDVAAASDGARPAGDVPAATAAGVTRAELLLARSLARFHTARGEGAAAAAVEALAARHARAAGVA